MRSTPAGSCSTSAHRMLGFQRSVQRLPSSKRQERKEASPAGACAQWAKGHMTARQKIRMKGNWSPTIPGRSLPGRGCLFHMPGASQGVAPADCGNRGGGVVR